MCTRSFDDSNQFCLLSTRNNQVLYTRKLGVHMWVTRVRELREDAVDFRDCLDTRRTPGSYTLYLRCFILRDLAARVYTYINKNGSHAPDTPDVLIPVRRRAMAKHSRTTHCRIRILSLTESPRGWEAGRKQRKKRKARKRFLSAIMLRSETGSKIFSRKCYKQTQLRKKIFRSACFSDILRNKFITQEPTPKLSKDDRVRVRRPFYYSL